MSQTYVLDGVEVKLTGREAIKEQQQTSRRTRETQVIQQILVEVTPVSSNDGTWKKWVALSELYIIKETKKNDSIS